MNTRHPAEYFSEFKDLVVEKVSHMRVSFPEKITPSTTDGKEEAR